LGDRNPAVLFKAVPVYVLCTQGAVGAIPSHHFPQVFGSGRPFHSPSLELAYMVIGGLPMHFRGANTHRVDVTAAATAQRSSITSGTLSPRPDILSALYPIDPRLNTIVYRRCHDATMIAPC
jgi:hypothetical protein